jgi:hypothetical protein
MAYADYDFYKGSFFGNAISSLSDFNRLAERASEYLDYITMQPAGGLPREVSVRKACCALAEAYQVAEKSHDDAISDTGPVSAQTVGRYSVSYQSRADITREYETRLYSIAQKHLAFTGFMSRGGCRRVRTTHSDTVQCE